MVNKLQEALPLITGGVSNVTQGGMHNLNNMIQSRQEGQMGISTGDLFYGDKSLNSKLLTIPHPKVFEREFVLRPLAEVI